MKSTRLFRKDIEPSCQIDTELLFHTQIFHFNMKMVIKTTKLIKNVQSPQDRLSVEPNTKPNGITQLNRILTKNSSHSEFFTEKKTKSICRTATTVLGSFSLEQIQAQKERLG